MAFYRALGLSAWSKEYGASSRCGGGGAGPDPASPPRRKSGSHGTQHSAFELGGLFRPAGGVAGAVGMGAHAGQLAALDDQIFVPDGALIEIAFEDLTHAGGITGLGRQRGARDMRGHAVMRHGAPGMILRRRLREPDVAGIAR